MIRSLLALLLLPLPALAQSTAQEVVPGYLTTTGCPSGLTTCFKPNGAGLSALNITSATNVKPSPGRIGTVCLNTAASSASSVIDSTGTSVSAANTVLTLPSTTVAGTCVRLDWPALVGISVVPGTNGVMSVSYQ